jgi:DNA polymerase-4
MSRAPHILALHIADFPVAVARAVTPRLRDRPVVTVSSRRPLGRVLAVSNEARQTGVREGLRYPVAKRFCPDAAFLTPDRGSEVRAEYAILRAALQVSPCVERYGAGRIFVDIAGTRRLLGAPLDIAYRLQRTIAKRHSLRGALGISCRKVWSSLASTAVMPCGVMEVLPHREAEFLSLVPPEWVPGVGPKTMELLRDLNITNLAMLRQFEPPEILRAFGAAGRSLLQAIRQGEDEGPVPAVTDIAALLPLTEDAVEADVPLTEESAGPDAVRGGLLQLASSCGEKLRRQHRECRRLALTIGYGDGKTLTGTKKLPERTAVDSDLASAVQRLFATVHTRRVRLCRVALRCEDLAEPAPQTSLFPDVRRRREMHRLAALDAIRLRFGADAIRSGVALLSPAS